MGHGQIELSRGTRSWEVTWVDRVVEICDAGAVQTRQFSTPREAEEWALNHVADLRDAGFADGPVQERSPRAHPDLSTDEGRLVWADQLQGEQDPRGELIAIQAARMAAPTDSVLEMAEADCIARNRLAFFGHAAHFPELIGVRWHLGLADAVTIRLAMVCDLTDLVQQLLDHPTFSALKHLEIEDSEGWHLDAALEGVRIAEPTVPSLALRARQAPDDAALAKALSAIAGLETLTLQWDPLEVPPLPGGIHTLELCGEMEPEEVDALPASVRNLALLPRDAQVMRRLRPGRRVSECHPEPIEHVEVDAPWHPMEESESADALDVTFRPVWETWHHKEPIVAYEDDPEPAETSGMPVIADWNLRGEPDGPPEPDEEWWV